MEREKLLKSPHLLRFENAQGCIVFGEQETDLFAASSYIK
jgi:hypothetical protein